MMTWSAFVMIFLSLGVLEASFTGRTLVGHVAFHSTVSIFELKNLGRGETVIFDKVITNTGGAYFPTVGIFIAPLDGVYVFNVGAMSKPGKYEQLELVKDGSHIQRMYADAGLIQTYATASLTAVLELKRGNMVWVRAAGGSDEIHGEEFTFFSGWLL